MRPLVRRLARIAAVALLLRSSAAPAAPAPPPPGGTMIGMYVHQHWPYKHPYAARTWTYDDWRGYTGGLKKLGYNTIIIWPMLDVMPEPPAPSDREQLEKLARVIDMLHGELGMRVYLTLAPNIIAHDAVAGQSTFQERHFYHCNLHVNPGDGEALDRMIRRRERQMRPLAAADGVLIIDSDPGGYPDSTNAEFVRLLAEHRAMFDRLRPGIELVYWVWFGWPAWNRYCTTGKLEWGRPEEFIEALTMFKDLEPEPWGLAHGLEPARKLGIESRVIALQYGAIEGEPSFPLTNFGGDGAWKAGGALGPRGVIGNAQTHCLQLPNTLAFVRGAQGRPVVEADYLAFAGDLIAGAGEPIVEGWKALAGGDSARRRSAAEKIEKLSAQTLGPGELEGLLFGDPKRFLLDLACQLRYTAAAGDLQSAAASGAGRREPLRAYTAALEAWYGRHGYKNIWQPPEAIATLDSPELRELFKPHPYAETGFGRINESFYRKEVFTPRLLDALRATLARD